MYYRLPVILPKSKERALGYAVKIKAGGFEPDIRGMQNPTLFITARHDFSTVIHVENRGDIIPPPLF